jgi:hypothetical protein
LVVGCPGLLTIQVKSRTRVFVERLLPHAFFSVGEKVPEADEGALGACVL